MKKLSVTLKLFYGAITYNATGHVTSKAENISLQYGTPEWVNYLKHLRANGITEAKVVKAYDLNEINEKEPVESLNRYKEVEDVTEIQNEVNEYTKTPEAELTPDQKKIKELEAKINAFMSTPQFKTEMDNVNKDVAALKDHLDLKKARDEYENLLGKKGGPSWTLEQINQKIEDFKALEAARAKYLEVVGEKADEALSIEELEAKIKEKQS